MCSTLSSGNGYPTSSIFDSLDVELIIRWPNSEIESALTDPNYSTKGKCPATNWDKTRGMSNPRAEPRIKSSALIVKTA